ncbi:MAG: leucine-rich repeat domain-containing protein, partial [Methanomassiliicoccaceae archaeon]|nr:leucine-rich repeat domain-containing protein [Methanomassiliicoccaceae archaeon]
MGSKRTTSGKESKRANVFDEQRPKKFKTALTVFVAIAAIFAAAFIISSFSASEKGNFEQDDSEILGAPVGTTLVDPGTGLTYRVESDGNASVTSNVNQAAYVIKSTIFIVDLTYDVTTIQASAFLNRNLLTSVTIPTSITSIGAQAFQGCNNVGFTSVTIPTSVTTLGQSAFQGCSGLQAITIPNSVTSIGNNAFQSCTALVSANIPNNLTTMGSGVFQSCINLTTITFTATSRLNNI